MKTYKRLFEKVISFENLLQAAHKAARCKRTNRNVARFNFGLEGELLKLQEELLKKTYRHGRYRKFTVYDPKVREIAAAPFRDRVVHHAVHDVIEPLIDKSFIYDSYACRKDKGTHKALDRAQSFLRANRFCLHGDIRKYFYSINHDILKEILRRMVEDRDLLWLLDEIIDSAVSSLSARHCEACEAGRSNPKNEIASGTEFTLSEANVCPRNDRSITFARNDGLYGLPIGNLTSQFFANLYMNELDYFVKFDLRIDYYLRYMDDFLIFGDDKKELVAVRDRIRHFLKERLTLNLHESKSQVYKTRNGVKFLGFRIYNDYRRLASDNVRRFRKRMKRFAYLACHCEARSAEAISKSGIASRLTAFGARNDMDKIRDSVRCWVAHSKYANTRQLRLNIWSGLREENEPFANLLKDILLDGIEIASGTACPRNDEEKEKERERESKNKFCGFICEFGFVGSLEKRWLARCRLRLSRRPLGR